MIMSVTGHLADDPTINEIGDSKVTNFRIGHNRRAKVEGEWTDKTDWYSVAVWGSQSEACERYLAKGRKVTVEGRLEPREYEDKDGNKRVSLDVRAYNVEFHGGGNDEKSDAREPAATGGGQSAPDDDKPLDF